MKELNSEEISNMSESIEERLEKLEVLGTILTKKQTFGLTLQEMYSMKRVLMEKDDNLDCFFREFRKLYPFKKFNYKELVSICSFLLADERAYKYYRLKKIVEDNGYSLYIKENIDIYDLEDSKQETEQLLELYEKCLKELKDESKYFQYSKYIAINNKSIDESARKINEGVNGQLLEKLTNGSKFEFLKNILISDEFDKIVQNFDNNEEVIESLKKILEVLNKYDEISSLKGTVNDIKENQIIVLDYVYSKEENFERASEILNKLPSLATQAHISRLQREYANEG